MGLITGLIVKKATKKAAKAVAKTIADNKEDVGEISSNLVTAAKIKSENILKQARESTTQAKSGKEQAIETIVIKEVDENRIQQLADKKAEEIVANKKSLKDKKEKAKTSIAALVNLIDDLEDKYKHEYVTKHDEEGDEYEEDKYESHNDQINRKISRYINAYCVQEDKDEFILMLETISSRYSDSDEVIKKAWKNKYLKAKTKAKQYFDNDEEVKLVLRETSHVVYKGRVKKILLFIVLPIVIVGALAAIITVNATKKPDIPEPPSAEYTILLDVGLGYFEGKHYMDVNDYFVEKGFENITTNPLHDLITGWISKENTVKTVTINGRDDYKAYRWYTPLDPVVINYHSY